MTRLVDRARWERHLAKKAPWKLGAGKTHLKADCPECGKLAEMTVYSVNSVCTKISIACKKCNTVSLVYARKS